MGTDYMWWYLNIRYELGRVAKKFLGLRSCWLESQIVASTQYRGGTVAGLRLLVLNPKIDISETIAHDGSSPYMSLAVLELGN